MCITRLKVNRGRNVYKPELWWVFSGPVWMHKIAIPRLFIREREAGANYTIGSSANHLLPFNRKSTMNHFRTWSRTQFSMLLTQRWGFYMCKLEQLRVVCADHRGQQWLTKRSTTMRRCGTFRSCYRSDFWRLVRTLKVIWTTQKHYFLAAILISTFASSWSYLVGHHHARWHVFTAKKKTMLCRNSSFGRHYIYTYPPVQLQETFYLRFHLYTATNAGQIHRAPLMHLPELPENLSFRLAETELANLAVPPRYGRTRSALHQLFVHMLGHNVTSLGSRTTAFEVIGLADERTKVNKGFGRIVLTTEYPPLACRIVWRVLVAAKSTE